MGVAKKAGHHILRECIHEGLCVEGSTGVIEVCFIFIHMLVLINGVKGGISTSKHGVLKFPHVLNLLIVILPRCMIHIRWSAIQAHGGLQSHLRMYSELCKRLASI